MLPGFTSQCAKEPGRTCFPNKEYRMSQSETDAVILNESETPASSFRSGLADANEALLDLLAEGKADVRSMADALGWRLGDLGRWMNDVEHACAVEGLLRLEDARAQLTLGRYRVAAATVLLRIASDDKAGESVRKACVDLLTVNTVPAAVRTRQRSAAD